MEWMQEEDEEMERGMGEIERIERMCDSRRELAWVRTARDWTVVGVMKGVRGSITRADWRRG